MYSSEWPTRGAAEAGFATPIKNMQVGISAQTS